MKFSAFAGTAIVPTLGRLVLALAFVTAGYNLLTGIGEFTEEQKKILDGLGVTLEPVGSAAAATDRQGEAFAIVPASFRPSNLQDEQAPPADGADQTPPAKPQAGAGEGETEGGEKPVVTLDETAPTAPEPAAPGTKYRGRKLWGISCMAKSAGLPMPKLAGPAAALMEFVGGSLLLIGFLSRLWGLGLAFTMGVAFYLTSMHPYLSTGPFTVAAGTDGFALFHRVFAQLALLVLALGVFFTGPGPLSVDRIIFGRGRRGAEVEDDFDTGGTDDHGAGGATTSTGVRPL